MRTLGTILAITSMLLAVGAGPALAWDDTWSAVADATGEVTGTISEPTGYYDDNEFCWFYYPNTDFPVPGTDWWNAWFLNGELIIPSGKTIEIVVENFQPGPIEICINYSDTAYDNTAVPPLPGQDNDGNGISDEQQILRAVYREVFTFGEILPLEILSYNPAWVSVDIRLDPGESASGTIFHECHGASPIEPQTWSAIKAFYQ